MSRCASIQNRLFKLFVALSLVLIAAPAALAQTAAQIVRIEEDWELVVGNPDYDSTAPQVTCAFSPVSGVQSLYATLELNYQSLPEFVPGGIQLQLWNGEQPYSSRKFPNGALLNTPGETITWTQTMEVSGGNLTFEIINGHSQSWGNFGGQGYLRASVSTTLADLNGYNPNTSVANSGVGYASNRVSSLVLKRIRVTTATGETYEDGTERIVHQLQ